MSNGQDRSAGEGDTTATELVAEEVGRLRTEVDRHTHDIATLMTEFRQRPTKTQVVLGALAVVFVLLTPAAIFLSALIGLASGDPSAAAATPTPGP